jgi:hypothetical protein
MVESNMEVLVNKESWPEAILAAVSLSIFFLRQTTVFVFLPPHPCVK